MAILKCKMCGGDLEISEGVSVCECEYCGTKQTVPNADDEKKITLFGRANRLRFACEFDKAAGVYESIVADSPEEAEAYWGLVLCKYGIEYVDDPASGKKIPTCHRSSFESVMDDSNFEQALENADAVARSVYRDEAKQIEELRKGIIEVSSKEEPYDIFICYKETDDKGDRTVDSVIAQDVYTEMTEKGYRVFFSRISLEDKLGTEYEPYIFAALNSAKVMLAFGTDYEYYNAVWVKNEWSRFLQLIAKGEKKTLIPCYKDIDAYDMPKEFAKLQAQDMGKVGAIQDLLRGIEKILPKKTETTVQVVNQVSSTAAPGVESLLERAFMFLEDCEWDQADEYCDKVLDIDPKCAEAYLGKLMAELRTCKQEYLAYREKPFDNSLNYRRACQFDAVLAEQLNGYIAKINETQMTYIYDEAVSAKNAAKTEAAFKSAAEMFETISDFKDANVLAEQCHELAEKTKDALKEQLPSIRKKTNLLKTLISVNVETVGLCSNGTVVATGANDYGQCNVSYWRDISAVSAGYMFTVGLRYNGTVVATGVNNYGQCNVSNWNDIIAISAGGFHTVGLKTDGTAVATGENKRGQCNVQQWRSVASVYATTTNTIGLKSDGTVVASGMNDCGQCNVGGWTDIVAIATDSSCTIGLKSDGTVVATGRNDYGQCNVSYWKNIIAVFAGGFHTVGLKPDGTVVATGDNGKGQCNVDNWKDIVDISAGYEYTIGLKPDGTVIATGDNKYGQCNVDGWTDIVAIFAAARTAFGLKANGAIVATGQNNYGQRNVSNWKLFDDIKSCEALQKMKQEQKRIFEENRAKALQLQSERRQKGLCQYCGGEFKKSLFSTKCANCGKSKDY